MKIQEQNNHLAENIPVILRSEALEYNFDKNTKEIIETLRIQVQNHKENLGGRPNVENPRMRMMHYPGMEPKMNPINERVSAEIGQPMYNHPGSPSYQPTEGQMYRGGHKPFIPNAASQQFLRPSSTNNPVHPMQSNMVPGMMAPGSPPVPQFSNQPTMMAYPPQMAVPPNSMLAPNDANSQNMMRMGQNQSPYYHQMVQPQFQYNTSGMVSPGMMQPQPQNK